MSSTPPFRSSPNLVVFTAITAAEAAISPATSSRIRVLRRRSLISPASLLLGGQQEQQPAVVVVGREHVRLGAGHHVAFAAHAHRYLERAHSPLQNGRHRIVAVRE